MRVELILNEASGGATERSEIEHLLAGATLVDRDPDRLVVAGGDGSIGPAAARAAELGVPLGILPTGTANDFARVHGLPDDLEAAAAVALGGTPVAHDLARLDGHPFVNVAAAGLAPAAAERAEPLKPLLRAVAYPVGAVLAGALEDPLPVRVDGHFDGEAWQVIVACSGAFGGGAEIAAADPHDGELDLVIVPEGSRAELARAALSMRRGDLADRDDVVHVRAAELELHVPAGTPFNLDGEVVTTGPSVHVCVQGRFQLVRAGTT